MLVISVLNKTCTDVIYFSDLVIYSDGFGFEIAGVLFCLSIESCIVEIVHALKYGHANICADYAH